MIDRRTSCLITAVGSPLGQSVAKALLQVESRPTIHVSDISDYAAGLYFGADHSVILPPFAGITYPQTILGYLIDNHIDYIFPTLEREAKHLRNLEPRLEDKGIRIVANSQSVIDLCNDKYLSMKFLESEGFRVPYTMKLDTAMEIQQAVSKSDFPAFMKPRFAASGLDAFVVSSPKEMLRAVETRPPGYFILQELLTGEIEYTVGVYSRLDRAQSFSFCLEREVKFGLSYRGRVNNDSAIMTYCDSIAQSLQSVFSINIQLKLHNNSPVCFEINPRFSSTVSIRAHYGFNEPWMALADLEGLDPTPIATANSGRFTRFWDEIYLESD